MAKCPTCGKIWWCSDPDENIGKYYLDDGEEWVHCTRCRCDECHAKAIKEELDKMSEKEKKELSERKYLKYKRLVEYHRTKLDELLVDHDCVVPEKRDEFGFAECELCGEQLGWYCPDSPDHICHYYSEDKIFKDEVILLKIRLINDEIYLKTANEHYNMFESRDECLFCGEPDERK